MAGRRASRARQARAPDQHFLRSRRLAADIVRDAGIASDDVVVELGAGTGVLTAELARRARTVIAVELDPRLAERLRQRFGADGAVRVIEGDMLRFALPAESFAVVANLPFGVTTAVLRHLLDDPRTPLRRADLVVEWGVGIKRALVWPSTLLGATWGAWYSFALTRRLPASCFSPRPGVDATLLTVTRRETPLVPVAEAPMYRTFVRAGFERGLRAIAPPRQHRKVADIFGFPRDATPRELDAHQWAALWRAVRSTR